MVETRFAEREEEKLRFGEEKKVVVRVAAELVVVRFQR